MKYALIIAIVSGASDDERTVLAAAELAKRDGASLKVIPAFLLYGREAGSLVWSEGFGGGALTAAALDQIAAAERKARDDMRRIIEQVGETLDIGGPTSPRSSITLIDDDQPPWTILVREAPLADVLVVGAATVREGGFWSGVHTDALMTLRMPLLVVRAPETLEGGKVAIAWDGSLASGRAVRAALPLLRAAKDVVVLQDPQGMTSEELLAGDPMRLKIYLLAQGIQRVGIKTVGGLDDGAALLAAAEAEGAACLVSGAFGHSRIRAFFGGGATRRFIAEMTGPHLLMAH